MAVSNNWKNLRSFLRKSYNREVNEWFKDVTDPTPNNNTPRQQAKRACLVLPKETQNTALIKMLTFRFTVQRVHLRPHIIGTPIGTFDSQRKYRPQIVLEFTEDELDVEAGYARVDGRISFRLMNETSESISSSTLLSIANKIKLEFGTGEGFVWRKGKDLASYTDKANGYQFQLLVRNKIDAKEIISKVLDLNNDTPNWSKLSYKENEEPTEAYPIIPPTQNILNKLYREPRIRPIASVHYTHSYCKIWGLANPIILHDRSLSFIQTLVDNG